MGTSYTILCLLSTNFYAYYLYISIRTFYTFLCLLSTYFYAYFLHISIVLSTYFYAYFLHISMRTFYTFPKPPLHTPVPNARSDAYRYMTA